MNPWNVQQVEATGDTQLHVKFADGTAGAVKFGASHLHGVFAPLRDPMFFKQAFVQHGAVTWPGGQVDLAPDAMYDAIKANGTWELQ